MRKPELVMAQSCDVAIMVDLFDVVFAFAYDLYEETNKHHRGRTFPVDGCNKSFPFCRLVIRRGEGMKYWIRFFNHPPIDVEGLLANEIIRRATHNAGGS